MSGRRIGERFKAITRQWRSVRVSLSLTALFAGFLVVYGVWVGQVVLGIVGAFIVLIAGCVEVLQNHDSLLAAVRWERDAEEHRESRRQ